ncbi:MAG: sigma factor-like helix-turn-helix DNA-binding protein [Synergistes sp.]|nr:sigma factor-like helix-turn-helix DNA-binding protein [Synergistes sp.]
MVRESLLERRVRDGEMLDLYGELLTDKQRDVFRMYVMCDFTLAEIGKSIGVSRQGVHDLITRSRERMEMFDRTFRLCDKRGKLKEIKKITEENKERMPKDVYTALKGILDSME